jgi:nitrile hydratase accessory protein
MPSIWIFGNLILSASEAHTALTHVALIPRDIDGPVFPAPWAARAFAMAVALNERGVFAWSEWSETLGPHVARATADDPADPEAYWQAWLSALEDILSRKDVGSRADLLELKHAWRDAAEHTPHGQPIELPGRPVE